MLSRNHILSLVASLLAILCGESFACDVSESLSVSGTNKTEIAIIDADIPNPTSLLSGTASSRSINSNARRHFQHNSDRRIGDNYPAQRRYVGTTAIVNSRYEIEPSVIGGLVSERAFYSLCCLRI